MQPRHVLAVPFAVPAALLALVACGGGETNAAAGDSIPGPTVEQIQGPGTDSAFRAADQTLDSAGRAGVSVADGIDSAAARGAQGVQNSGGPATTDGKGTGLGSGGAAAGAAGKRP